MGRMGGCFIIIYFMNGMNLPLLFYVEVMTGIKAVSQFSANRIIDITATIKLRGIMPGFWVIPKEH